uniref:Uncharacterized protein n=1 Tax=Phlebotomus papatasi TaxID=29031 RepID=A0A1B0GMU5_PHLPP
MFNKFKNNLRKYKQAVQNKKLSVLSSSSLSSTAEEAVRDISDLLMENVEWLKSHCDPWDEVISKWKATSVWRVESIKKDSESSLASILDAWPGFKDPRGFDLVDIDFETMFPQVEESPSEKFAQLKKKLIPLFGMEIKDKYSKGLLKKLGDSNTN